MARQGFTVRWFMIATAILGLTIVFGPRIIEAVNGFGLGATWEVGLGLVLAGFLIILTRDVILAEAGLSRPAEVVERMRRSWFSRMLVVIASVGVAVGSMMVGNGFKPYWTGLWGDRERHEERRRLSLTYAGRIEQSRRRHLDEMRTAEAVGDLPRAEALHERMRLEELAIGRFHFRADEEGQESDHCWRRLFFLE